MITADFIAKTYKQALLNFKKANFLEAIRQFRHCISLDYEIKESYYYIGLYYYYNFQLSEAFKYFQMATSGESQHAQAYYYLGKLCQAFENNSDAVSYYKKSIEYAGNTLTPLLSFKELQPFLKPEEQTLYKEKAFQTFIIQLNHPPQQELLTKAFREWIHHHFEQAESYLLQVKELSIDFFEPYLFLAHYYFEMKKYKESRAYWKILHQKFHLEKMGLLELAKIEMYLKNYKKAIIHLKAYLNFFQNAGYADYFNLALLYSLIGEQSKAIHFYTKSLQYKESFFPALYNLAISLQKVGELDKAIQFYEKAESIEGNNVDIYYNLGLIYFEKRDYINSLFHFNKAYQIEPSFKEAKENFYYISYIRMVDDVGFSKDNYSLFINTFVAILVLLAVLSILYFFGVI